MKPSTLACGLLCVAFGLFAQQQNALLFDGKSWWEDVRVLADDHMEGRETGSEGLRRAQAFIIKQLESYGVRPAGANGFEQRVEFVTRQIVEKDSSLTLEGHGSSEPLVLGDDAYFSTRTDLAPEVRAPLVFVGYGLQVPENNYDDFARLDLKGKIAVYISGSPAEIPAALASHYQSASERGKALLRAGAVGTVSIPNPASMDIPWSRMSLSRTHPSMALAGAEFRDPAGMKVAIVFNPAQAEKLFAGSGHTFGELTPLAKDRRPLPRFPLALSLSSRAALERKTLESANLVAAIPGSDPKLKNEYVVLSAHLDHLGIGEPINGDRIYNGAMDDGSGSAVLLDLAASFHAHPAALRRSLLFVWVTAEEKGLLGSRYFAAHPTVPADSLVADINVDMFLPILPPKVICVLGLTDSDLGDRARQIITAHGLRAQPDPEPLRNRFIRSDQYNFIQRGIPAVKMDYSFEPGSPEQKVFKDWLTNRYHAPSDDLEQPVDLGAAALYEQIVRELLINVANSDARPEWKPGSFFRRFAAGDSKALPGRAGAAANPNPQSYLGLAYEVLTPNPGVQLTSYLAPLMATIKKNLFAAIPERPKRDEEAKAGVNFKILRDGSIPASGIATAKGSHWKFLENALMKSIRDAGPFDPLPAGFAGPAVELRLYCVYYPPQGTAR